MNNLNTSFSFFWKVLLKPSVLPYLGVIAVFIPTFEIFQSGDDQALLHGLTNAFACLGDTPIKIPCGASVVHFPIFQYLVASPFKLLGLNDAAISQAFGIISLLLSLIAGAAFWRMGSLASGPSGGHFALLVLLSGYLLFYMTSSFNEATSFSLMALLVLSVIDRWKIIHVCFIALACTITKEIAFPYVLYFMFIAYIARIYKEEQILYWLRCISQFLHEYKFAILSVLTGIAINLSFNYFRYGNIKNEAILGPSFFTPWEYVPEFFVDLFISPAGGLVFIWLSLCVLIVAPMIFLIRNRIELLILGAALVGLISANLGFARWWSSFGWNAWGARLTLPILGSISILFIYIATPYVIKYFQSARGKKYVFIIFMIFAFSSLPNLAARMNASAFYNRMFSPPPVSAERKKEIEASAHRYQEEASEGYARNVVIPTTYEIVMKKLPKILLWLLSLYFINRLIFVPERDLSKSSALSRPNMHHHPFIAKFVTITNGMTRQAVLVLIALFILLGSTLTKLTWHDAVQTSQYSLQQMGLFGVKARYKPIPPHEDLVKSLATFPAALPLVEIQIEMKEPETLNMVRVLAGPSGEWTTLPDNPGLWGIVVVDKKAGNKVLNDWPRKEQMNLPVGRQFTLWIPNSGDMSACPKFELEFLFGGGKHVRALAGC